MSKSNTSRRKGMHQRSVHSALRTAIEAATMVALAIALIAATTIAADWPGWRGASGVGVSTDESAPLAWSQEQNVRWRVDLPEPGNSTPVVWEDRIFVTQPLSAQKQVALLCFDRATGAERWRKEIANENPGPTHEQNYQASASPATDGQIVVAWFGSAGLFAYDLEGKEIWRRDLGPQKHIWGYASSPVIHGNKVFLNFGPGERSFLVALDKTNGEPAWQVDVPAGTGSAYADWTPEDMYGSWSTPVVVQTADREELVVAWPRIVVAFDPATGRRLWTCEGMGDLVYPSPVIGQGVVVAMAGFTGASLAVRAGGEGNVTESHRLWRVEQSSNQIGSGVISGDYLFTVERGGIAECTQLRTGEKVWTERLPARGAAASVWSSLVLHRDTIYVANQSGEVLIFKVGPKFELVASNTVDEPTNASVVIAGGDLYLRTFNRLWAISSP